MGKIKVIKGKDGHKAIKFHEGGLHSSLGVKSGDKIPASKFNAALSGREGAKAEKQANFARNVLKVKK